MRADRNEPLSVMDGMAGILDWWLRKRRPAPKGRTGAGGKRGRSGAVCESCGAPGARMCAGRLGLAVMFLCGTCRRDMLE